MEKGIGNWELGKIANFFKGYNIQDFQDFSFIPGNSKIRLIHEK